MKLGNQSHLKENTVSKDLNKDKNAWKIFKTPQTIQAWKTDVKTNIITIIINGQGHRLQNLVTKYDTLKQKKCNKNDRTSSTGASDKCFYSTFIKSFDHLETLLTIHRPKIFLSVGSLCGPLVPVLNLNAPKGPSYYPKSIMLQFQICYHSHLNVS